MSDLSAMQARFAELLGRAPARDPAEVFAGDAASLAPRLAIYRGTVQANGRKALAAAYPIIEQLVGAEFFDALGREYAKLTPSRDGDLSAYGETFDLFLSGFPHVSELPYLPDVARLEWAIHRAHYAADADKLDPVRLAGVPAEAQGRLRWRLHPACALLDSGWPLARIWEVHRADHSGDGQVAFDTRMHHCLVHRPAWRVLVSDLDEGAYAFLAAVQEGAPLERCVERALAVDGSFDLGAAIAAWIDARVIVDFFVTGA
ncbi:MAG: DNA-binding domain-containing protein [Betaproteobacteria bacterium]